MTDPSVDALAHEEWAIPDSLDLESDEAPETQRVIYVDVATGHIVGQKAEDSHAS